MKKYFLGIGLLAFVSCTSSGSRSNQLAQDSTTVTTKEAGEEIKLANPVEQRIYDAYIVLKNTLVNSDVNAAQHAAEKLAESLKEREGCETSAAIAGLIKDAKDISRQREEFVKLSSEVIALFKNAPLKGGTIYVQHCPMANNGNGADWIASQKSIKNPYYGSEMMECGSVVQEIKSDQQL